MNRSSDSSSDPLLRFRPEFPILEKTTYLALAEERGWRCSTPRDPARRGGTAAVDFESALEVSRELNSRDVVVDYRPGVGIQMSPHFSTEDREIDHAIEAIDEIRAAGAWRRWQGSPSLVT
jgi:kynureninase